MKRKASQIGYLLAAAVGALLASGFEPGIDLQPVSGTLKPRFHSTFPSTLKRLPRVSGALKPRGRSLRRHVALCEAGQVAVCSR